MIQAKIWGIENFGSLLRKHNIDYATKWLEKKTSKGDQILGALDNSSLADINGSYAPIKGMKLVPINYKMVVFSFVMNTIPYIPLVFTYYSVTDLFNAVLNSIL